MRKEIIGAIARGWCSPENSHKEMDTTLAEAIANEVMKVIDTKSTSDNSNYPKLKLRISRRALGVILLNIKQRLLASMPKKEKRICTITQL